ncbi:hypothetical protein NEOLEDRAFT_1171329 [Neolentinus lepideus HHB14362 ss-1]|uniref:ATP phosphoribosyltransferase n=1 Tax=Neolentinus lepideus HHB14362 ss-1 TaxID=1314782 RepID=A0A165QI99_9AGAM|nr:hypothetical protein NEOLEDRAFT_1171329 [Neolentinus lepideus HHB14362 ss-1]
MSFIRFKLVFFTPASSTRSILDYLFARHPQTLGKIGNYDQCAFVTRGTAKPVIGEPEKLTFVEEDRVELVVNDKGEYAEIKEAISTLKEIHPYEEVAYDVYRLEDF